METNTFVELESGLYSKSFATYNHKIKKVTTIEPLLGLFRVWAFARPACWAKEKSHGERKLPDARWNRPSVDMESPNCWRPGPVVKKRLLFLSFRSREEAAPPPPPPEPLLLVEFVEDTEAD